jgi:hypothetical protein
VSNVRDATPAETAAFEAKLAVHRLKYRLLEQNFAHEPWWMDGIDPDNALRFVSVAQWNSVLSLELIASLQSLTTELRSKKGQP